MKTRKKVKNKILSLVLSVAILIGILPQITILTWANEQAGDTQGGAPVTTATAISVEVTIGEGDPVQYATFKEAWTEAKTQATTEANHATVKLLADVTSEDTIWESGKIENYENFITLDLNGFTIDRGLTRLLVSGPPRPVDMGCVILVTNATLIIQDSSSGKKGTITGGNSYDNGGGIFANNSNLTISDVTITGNKAGSGGGIAAKDSTLTISNVTITENEASSGGGLYIDKTNYTIANATVSNNTSYNEGGGIYIVNGNPQQGNPVKTDLTSFSISGSLIENNQSTDSSMGRGAGVYVQYANLIMNGGSIRGNVANGGGGGMYADHFFSDNNVTLNGVQIKNNQASIYGGGGLVAANRSSKSFVLINGGEVKNNIANMGAGIRVSGNFKVKGNVDITENFILDPDYPDNDNPSNVRLDSGSYITIDGPLAGAKMGVSQRDDAIINFNFTKDFEKAGVSYPDTPETIFTADHPYTKVAERVNSVYPEARLIESDRYTVLFYVNAFYSPAFAAPPQYVLGGQDTTAATTASLASAGNGYVLAGWTENRNGTGKFYAQVQSFLLKHHG